MASKIKTGIIEWALGWATNECDPVKAARRNLVTSAVLTSCLTPREGWVVRMIEFNNWTASELARMCGVSREIIARLHRSAHRKLEKEFPKARNMSIKQVWKTYLPGAKPWGNKRR